MSGELLANLPIGGGMGTVGKFGKVVDNVGDVVNTQRAIYFEKSLVNLSVGERVAVIRTEAKNVAAAFGWAKDSRLSRINERDVYKAPDGNLYSLDTQHGAWEKINPKTGNHEGQFRLVDLVQNKDMDTSGKHNLKVK